MPGVFHSWERPAPRAGAELAEPAAPPVPAPAAPDAAAQVAQPEAEPTDAEEAGQELAELLLSLHVDGKLTAKHTCLISYWAAKAGACGPVGELAHRPNAPSGHYQRHLDKKAGLRAEPEKFLTLQVPGHTKHDCRRQVHAVRVCPPHECLHREHAEDPDLAASVRDSAWPASYTAHPVVQANPGRPVVPLALYLDAAQYTKRDSVVVFVTCNLLSGARHLNCVLRKKDLCRCGCRGWHSYRPVMEMLAWSFAALGAGFFPAAQHTGDAWPQSDPGRRSMASLPLALRAAVCHIKGDWAEYSHTLGFPTWKHLDYPCLWCRAERDSLYIWDGLEPCSVPWRLTTQEDYEAACQRCERHVVITTQEQLTEVASLLYYDAKPQGSRGRALKKEYRPLQLKAGDRLEANSALRDVAEFELLALPATVLFWRPSLETLARHRNPLFAPGSGLSISSLTVDTLHCLYLGIFGAHCSQVVWAMIEADVWSLGREGHTSAVEKLHAACLRLQAECHRWRQQRRRSHPGEPLTEVQELAPNLIGTSRGEQKWALKGGETKTFLLFLHDYFPRYAAQVANSNHMVAGSGALVQHIRLLKESPRVFTDAQQQALKGRGPQASPYLLRLTSFALRIAFFLFLFRRSTRPKSPR